MKYAVFKHGGKQYKVKEGDTISLDNISKDNGSKVEFEEVLLKVSDDNIKIGKPFLKNEKVEGKLVESFKGEKLRVSKFKAKVRYRRTTGFRASLSKVIIEKI